MQEGISEYRRIDRWPTEEKCVTYYIVRLVSAVLNIIPGCG